MTGTEPADSDTDARAIELPAYGFACVQGAKAAEFLQGQLTCDLREANAAVVLPGAYCTVKGRVTSSFLLWQSAPECVLLRMRADIVAPTLALLAKYGVFSRVSLAAPDPALFCIGLLGSGLEEICGELFGAWPRSARELARGNGVCIVRRDTDGRMMELWGERAQREQLLAAIATRLPAGDPQEWTLQLIRRGAAEVQAATRELFLPQMLGLDGSGAVSFRKGCYTGQEIVARTHYKGATKRHLQRLAGASTSELQPGLELFAADTGRSAGIIVDVALAAPGECEMLAVLSDDALESGLQTGSGNRLHLLGAAHAMI